MKRLIACLGLLAATTLFAQQMPTMQHTPQQGPPKSPPATATATIAGKTLTITYSSPRVRGREGHIFTPDGLISKDPGYPVWRAGANEATKFVTDAELDFGTFKLPKGEYTLFVNISEPEAWVFVVNKQVGEWGLRRDAAQDAGTAKMKMIKPAAPREELLWTIKDLGKGKGLLEIAWESKVAQVEFTVR